MLIAVAMIAADFYLKNHDRVVFYGDSITEQKLYTSYVESFVLTRYPDRDITFFNRGWAGDSSWGGGGGGPHERISKDVKGLQPTKAVVLLGMNDGGYVGVDPKIESTIRQWYPKVLDLLQALPGTPKLTLIRTSPWDDVAHHYASEGKPPEPWAPWKGYNTVLQTYGMIVEEQAKNRGAVYIDFNEPLVTLLKEAVQAKSSEAEKIIPDGIHPGPGGHLAMAAELLKGWNVEPTVSSLEIDSRTSSVVSFQRTTVKILDSLHWEQKDDSLPFIIPESDETVGLVRKLSRLNEQLNRQVLRITHLPSGRYQLTVDAHPVATFSSEALEQGVNLADYSTPMSEQSLKVFDLCYRRSEVDFFAWRTVRRANAHAQHAAEAAEGVARLAEDMRTEAQKLAQPIPHKFKLTKM